MAKRLPIIVEQYLTRISYMLPLMLAGWGLWLWLTDAVKATNTYSKMDALMPGWAWMLLFVFAGMWGFHGAVFGDKHPGCRACQIFKMWGAAVVAGGWLFVLILLTIGNWRTTATYIYSWMFVLSILNFLDVSQILRWRPR